MNAFLSELGRQRRRLTTGLAFVVFMGGGLFVTLVFGPLFRFWPGSTEAKDFRIQRLIHYFFRFFMWGLVASGTIARFEVSGREHTGPAPRLFVANHPTLIDVVAIFSCLRQCDCLVKSALWDHFFLRGVVRAAGYIPNRDPLDLLQRCAHYFRDGRSLLIFPEGTRSPAGGLNAFTRGAARIALHTGMPITPVLISCIPPLLHKKQSWHQSPPQAPVLRICFQEPISLTEPGSDPQQGEVNADPARARELTARLEVHFHSGLGLKM